MEDASEPAVHIENPSGTTLPSQHILDLPKLELVEGLHMSLIHFAEGAVIPKPNRQDDKQRETCVLNNLNLKWNVATYLLGDTVCIYTVNLFTQFHEQNLTTDTR